MKRIIKKRIALVAHDDKKKELIEWAKFNKGTLEKHELFGTGTTGWLLQEEVGLEVICFLSGPLGGDQQLGAKVSEEEIDIVIFYWDPLESHSHDPDIKALLRIAAVWNIPIACNRATADFLISSPLLTSNYDRRLRQFPKKAPDFSQGMNSGGTLLKPCCPTYIRSLTGG